MTTSASTVVPHHCATVAARLAAVPSWAPALADVAWAVPVGFERYRFGLRHGRGVEEVLVAMRWDARNQRLTWRSFDGPTWTGQLKLYDVDGIRTRVQLDVLALPRTGFEAVTEMCGAGARNLLTELAALVEAALVDAALVDAALASTEVVPSVLASRARSESPPAPVIGAVPIGRTVLPQARRARGELLPQH